MLPTQDDCPPTGQGAQITTVVLSSSFFCLLFVFTDLSFVSFNSWWEISLRSLVSTRHSSVITLKSWVHWQNGEKRLVWTGTLKEDLMLGINTAASFNVTGTDRRKVWPSALSSLWWRRKSAMLTPSWTIPSDRGSSLSSKPRSAYSPELFRLLPLGVWACVYMHVDNVRMGLCSGQSWGRRWSHVHRWDVLHSAGVRIATDCWLGHGYRSSHHVPDWLQQHQGKVSMAWRNNNSDRCSCC